MADLGSVLILRLGEMRSLTLLKQQGAEQRQQMEPAGSCPRALRPQKVRLCWANLPSEVKSDIYATYIGLGALTFSLGEQHVRCLGRECATLAALLASWRPV